MDIKLATHAHACSGTSVNVVGGWLLRIMKRGKLGLKDFI